MININSYIIEKLKLNKGTKMDDNNPDDNLSKKKLNKLEKDIEDLVFFWEPKYIKKVYDKTESIIERYQLCYIIQQYCRVSCNGYSDIDKILMYFTDKGNIALYYDKHYLGAYANIKDYPIDKEFLKKFNLLVEDH